MSSFQLPEGIDLNTTPMGINPSGAPPNFVDPPTLAAVSYGVIITMMSLAYFVVGLRVLSAMKKDRRLKVDDYFCILAIACTSAYGIIIMLMNENARHSWDTPISFINETWLKRNAALCLLYGPSMFFSKVAICTLYLRIFNTVHWLRWTCWIAIVLFTCVYWSMVPVYAVYSFPHGDNETWTLPLVAKIGKADKMAIFTGTFNVASDLFLLAIPIPIILKLNLSMRKRVGLAAVFLTGIVGTVATALGLYFRVSLFLSKQDADGGDASWVAAATYITVLVELFVTIMVSCTPGVVSSWRNVLRETTVVTSLRSMLNNSRYSFSRSRSSTQVSKEKAASIQSSEADLNPPQHDTLGTYGGFEEYQPAPSTTGDSWGPIMKTVKIQQSEV